MVSGRLARPLVAAPAHATETIEMPGRLLLTAIVLAAFAAATPFAPAHAGDDKPIYVSTEGLACILKLAPIYLASSNEIARIGVHSCDPKSADNAPMMGEGRGGAGSGFGGGIGRLNQTVGGASRSEQATDTIVPANQIAVSKDQLRCIVAEAANLPRIKDTLGRDVVRLDALDCMKTS
jgi:hypothetical protein